MTQPFTAKTGLTVLLLLFSVGVYGKQQVSLGMLDLSYPPFLIIENQQMRGPDIDLIREIFSRVDDYELAIKPLPPKRVNADLIAGKLDMATLFRDSAPGAEVVVPLFPLHYSDYRIITLPGREFPFRKLSDLYPHRIGMVRGLRISNDFVEAMETGKINVEVSHNWQTQMRMLLSQRVDAIAGNRAIVQYVRSQMGITTALSYLPHPLAMREFHLLISRKSPNIDADALAAAVNSAMQSMRDDGSWQAILKRYELDSQFLPANDQG